jgi:hypothetical protein
MLPDRKETEVTIKHDESPSYSPSEARARNGEEHRATKKQTQPKRMKAEATAAAPLPVYTTTASVEG